MAAQPLRYYDGPPVATPFESNVSEEPGWRGLVRYGIPLALLVLAIVELAAHAVMRSRVPARSDWKEAGAFVRARHRERDLVLAAPSWADPLVRLAVGDTMSFAEAGYDDLARFDRLWVLSIRGRLPELAPDERPAIDRRFGAVRVVRWDLGPSPVRFDFVDHLATAEVALGAGGSARPCVLATTAPMGGGLGAGAYAPATRFVCDPRAPALWVGETITEDLELRPRRCVHQPPVGERPLRAVFRGVPAGERLVLYAGLYYEDERHLEGGPFTVVVRRDGAEIARVVHHDGEGFRRVEIELEDTRGAPSTYAIETTTRSPKRRSVCWSATIRGPRRERAR